MNSIIKTVIGRGRARRGETQARVAERLGVSQQLVSRVEQGKGNLRQLARVCRGLGIGVSLRVGDETLTLVHPLDPDERAEIEANIAWFSRLAPADRLRTIRKHVAALDRLRAAMDGT